MRVGPMRRDWKSRPFKAPAGGVFRSPCLSEVASSNTILGHSSLDTFFRFNFYCFFCFYEMPQLVHEFFHIFKIQIYRSEADVGDFVVAAQAIHDEFAEFAGLALAFLRIDDKGFGLVHNLLELADWHRPFLTCTQQAVQNFLAVEFLAASVLLDHHVRNFIDALVGGEALGALQALAAAADRLRLFAFARVDYLVIGEAAKGTFHGAENKILYS